MADNIFGRSLTDVKLLPRKRALASEAKQSRPKAAAARNKSRARLMSIAFLFRGWERRSVIFEVVELGVLKPALGLGDELDHVLQQEEMPVLLVGEAQEQVPDGLELGAVGLGLV